MRLKVEAKLAYHMPEQADVLLAIEGAQTVEQRLVDDLLTVSSMNPLRNVPGDDGIGRRTWACVQGDFQAEYRGTFDVERSASSLVGLPVSAHADLPAHVIPYLWPSRFCEADRFISFVTREFADFQGGAKIDAMAKWIGRNIEYRLGASHGTTSAVDSFVSREGVCRDFSHVMAAFARAAGIPARLVSAYAWQLDPPDFHAVVDVWLDDAWHLVDASGLAPVEGLVRIAVGRDATDISFMTIFGYAELVNQEVSVTRLDVNPVE